MHKIGIRRRKVKKKYTQMTGETLAKLISLKLENVWCGRDVYLPTNTDICSYIIRQPE